MAMAIALGYALASFKPSLYFVKHQFACATLPQNNIAYNYLLWAGKVVI